MRRSIAYYPEQIDLFCDDCNDEFTVDVTEIQDDDVRVECPECEEIYYVRIDF